MNKIKYQVWPYLTILALGFAATNCGEEEVVEEEIDSSLTGESGDVGTAPEGIHIPDGQGYIIDKNQDIQVISKNLETNGDSVWIKSFVIQVNVTDQKSNEKRVCKFTISNDGISNCE